MQITPTDFQYVKVIPWGMKSEWLPASLQNGLSKACKKTAWEQSFEDEPSFLYQLFIKSSPLIIDGFLLPYSI